MKRVEDTQSLAKLMVKYSPMSPSKAIKELLEIDFIKNNFSKNTIYNYLQGTRSLIKTGYPTKYIPKDLVQVIEKIKEQNKEEQPKYLEKIEIPIKRKEKTTEELIQELQEKKQKLVDKYNEEKRKIDNKLSELSTKMTLLREVYIEEEGKIGLEIVKLREKQVKEMLGI